MLRNRKEWNIYTFCGYGWWIDYLYGWYYLSALHTHEKSASKIYNKSFHILASQPHQSERVMCAHKTILLSIKIKINIIDMHILYLYCHNIWILYIWSWIVENEMLCKIYSPSGYPRQICFFIGKDWINLALHHLLTNWSSEVNGCRQSESTKSW